jgi:hypothetical protein
MLCSEAQFIFHLLSKSLAADHDRLRPGIVSSRDVSARSCFDPFTMRLLKYATMGDVPEKAAHETMIGPASLQLRFRYQTACYDYIEIYIRR